MSGKPQRVRMFVLAMPGLATLVRRELAALSGVQVTGSGHDGRADVLLCEVEPGRERALAGLRSVDDVFVEVSRTLRSEGDKAHWTAGRLWRPARVDRALAVWRSTLADEGTPRHNLYAEGSPHHKKRRAGRPGEQSSPAGLTFRVVARVLSEHAYQRTDLRRSLTQQVERTQRTWRPADPAALEIWAMEYARGKFVAGLRLSNARMRQHGGRESERPGALRPAVAAAMVSLAGPPAGILLDPCCGSGTILAEAQATGWRAEGCDIDPSAVAVARRNVPRSVVRTGDTRSLDLTDASVDACVSNLPFGRRYAVEGRPDQWLRSALAELARVTRPGGHVVLLIPSLPRAVLPPALRLTARHQLRLLGTSTTIWHLRHSARG